MFRKVTVRVVLAGLAVVCFSSATWATPIVPGDRWLLDMSTLYSGTTDSLGRAWNAIIPTAGTKTSNLLNTAGETTSVAIWWAWDNALTNGASDLSATALTDYPNLHLKIFIG